MKRISYDIIIVGGGFYGCALALYLRASGAKVAILESTNDLLSQASAINQARVHTGLHYPRSFVTALRSLQNYPRFVADFSEAIFDSFKMVYAISSVRSQITGHRFFSLYKEMGLSIEPVDRNTFELFNKHMIDAVFICEEPAFNHNILRELIRARLEESKVDVVYNTHLASYERSDSGVNIISENENVFHAPLVFNITYSQLNKGLIKSNLQPIGVKHEWTEIVLIKPPEELAQLGITVMDGPFFSTMPYPANNAYSLTHVRYTPHYGWVDEAAQGATKELKINRPVNSQWRHMVHDAARYVPCLNNAVYKKSLYITKTVPIHNEINDGRPILFHKHQDMPGLFSVLGSKIDNIYDLFESVKSIDSRFDGTNTWSNP